MENSNLKHTYLLSWGKRALFSTVEAPEFGPCLAQPADAGVARAPARSGGHRPGGGRGAVCSAQERPGHGENSCNFVGKTSNHTYLWNRLK